MRPKTWANNILEKRLKFTLFIVYQYKYKTYRLQNDRIALNLISRLISKCYQISTIFWRWSKSNKIRILTILWLWIKVFFLPEGFNTNISHQLVDYIITVVNLQHKNTNSNGDLYSKPVPVLNIRFKVFWYTKKE